MPAVVLLLLLAPVPIAYHGMSIEQQKEARINDICVQKFDSIEDIRDCKKVLLKVDIER